MTKEVVADDPVEPIDEAKECESINIESINFVKKDSPRGSEPAEDNLPANIEENPDDHEKRFVGNFLFLTHTFVNLAHKVPHALKMLHGVIANPFHLKTLFDLMLTVKPPNQLKILRIV